MKNPALKQPPEVFYKKAILKGAQLFKNIYFEKHLRVAVSSCVIMLKRYFLDTDCKPMKLYIYLNKVKVKISSDPGKYDLCKKNTCSS